VVKLAAMKTSNGLARPQRARISQTQRAQLLAAFERSGLSAAAFARQHRVHYTTFCGWRQRQTQANPSPGFVQVELSASPPAVAELVLELGPAARVRITDAGQITLAARRLQALSTPTPC
jgi:transposase-like protein